MTRADWTLAPEAFERLLAALDPDRDRAAVHYERLRTRLVKLFEWRGCLRADEYADRTFDRVARRLADGAELRGEPYAFFHGVALNLLQEYWREPATRWTSIEGIEPAAPPSPDEDAEAAVRLDCLERCMGQLPPESRQLLATYHGAHPRPIDARRALAASLGIPLNALRIRMFRLRAALESCITACTGEPAK